MSEEDLQQEVSNWTEMHAGPEGNIKDDEADGAAEKEIIDVYHFFDSYTHHQFYFFLLVSVCK